MEKTLKEDVVDESSEYDEEGGSKARLRAIALCVSDVFGSLYLFNERSFTLSNYYSHYRFFIKLSTSSFKGT